MCFIEKPFISITACDFYVNLFHWLSFWVVDAQMFQTDLSLVMNSSLSSERLFILFLGIRVRNCLYVEIQRVLPFNDFTKFFKKLRSTINNFRVPSSLMKSLFFCNSFSHFALRFLSKKILTFRALLLILLGCTWVPGWSSWEKIIPPVRDSFSEMNTFDVNSQFYKHCNLHILFKNLYIFLKN